MRSRVTDLPARYPAHSLLSAEEERELGRRIQAGCQRSRDQLIEVNLRLACRVARSFRCPEGMEREDVQQEAIIGLTRAAEKWDPERGVRFSTYATPWCRQRVRRAIDDQGRIIRVPGYAALDNLNAHYAREALREELERLPDDDELAERLGWTEARVRGAATLVVSLDELLSNDRDDHGLYGREQTREDFLADPDANVEDEVCRRAAVDRATRLLRQLPERQQRIVTARLRGETLREIGEREGMSHEGVSQNYKQAIANLKALARGEGIDDAE